MKMKFFIGFLMVASIFAMPAGFSVFGIRAGKGKDVFLKPAIAAAAGGNTQPGKAEYEDHEIIVKFRSAEKPVKVFLAPDEKLKDAIEEYEKKPGVEYAELNYKYRASIIPSDTYYGEQWYLKKIKAQEAWDLKRESPNVVIAIIDSGVQISHPDLKENIWANSGEIPANGIDDDRDGYIDDINGWDFVNNEADPSPKFQEGFTEGGINHGTIVAGIAAASGNNATGIAGVTWRAKIMPLKVLGDAGEGSTLNVVRAIDYAIKKGANILNFSFVGFGYSEALNEAIGRAHAAGLIIVAAAGNESDDGEGYFLDDTPMYPVCHDGPAGKNWIIGVAAVDAIDQKSKFSSYGFKCIDIAAPGESVFGTVVYAPEKSIGEKSFNKYYDGYWSGTSVAAPQVSGAISLLLEADYELGRDKIIALLLDNSDNISRVNPAHLGQLGRGRLNVLNSMRMALSGVSAFKGGIMSVPFSGAEASLKISDKDGKIEADFPVFDPLFRGGANVTGGDIDGDGKDEIIVGPGSGGGPHVRIFSADGKVRGQFFAYDSRFRGGVNVAAGDIDADGKDEIIVGAGPGGGPHVRIFSADGKVRGQFFAYDSRFRGGVRVAAGNVYNSARKFGDQIITAPGSGLIAEIKIFDNKAGLLSRFNAFNSYFRGGISVSAGDLDADGRSEIIAGAGPGGAPHIRSFDSDGNLFGSYYALAADFNKGVNAGYVKIGK